MFNDTGGLLYTYDIFLLLAYEIQLFQGGAFKETEGPEYVVNASYSLYEFVGDLYHIVDLF
jgi:hypothetical protein